MKGVTITGCRPYDGEYPLDLARMKAVEYGLIKRLSGYLPGDVPDGIAGFDVELVCAIATVALQRAGKVPTDDGEAQARSTYQRLINLEVGSITLDLGADEEADAVPPEGSSTGNGSSHGPGSSRSSETSRHLPRVGGTRASGGAESAQLRSVS